MNLRKLLNSLVLITTSVQVILIAPSVKANCVDSVASLELVQPVMERLWQQLQTQTEYFWGTVRPYGQILDDRIILTADFDSLTGLQKSQVLDLLYLDYNTNWFDLLTPEEQEKALQNPGIGAMSPYGVYASDGRAISLPYNGCDRMTLLTEKARYSWYYSRWYPDNTDATSDESRNVGYPSWRQVRFPISAQAEKKVRLQFWRTMGYHPDAQGWWIAWVPEQGYFEINVPVYYQSEDLDKFWRVASTQYRYVVIDNLGTLRQEH